MQAAAVWGTLVAWDEEGSDLKVIHEVNERGFARTSCAATVAVLALSGLVEPPCEASFLPARPPAVAGAFYPEAAGALREEVERHLGRADPTAPAGGVVRALIVPHAGYAYSAPTAAFAYKLLAGRERPSRVVLIGPSHFTRLFGACSVAQFSAYDTPLGRVPVDVEAVERLTRRQPFHAMRYPHVREHCLEVQLPFLQALWPEPPKIVPILVGRLSPAQCRAAAAGIAEIVEEDTLIVVSTDFTHYGRGFAPFGKEGGEKLLERIEALDMEGVRHIKALDAEAFGRYHEGRNPTVCGGQPVRIALTLLESWPEARAQFLRWANSGGTTGQADYCVSYVAAAALSPAGCLPEMKSPQPNRQSEDEPPLSNEDRRFLLDLARASVERAARGEPAAEGDEGAVPPSLRRNGAAFVTLKREGRLRGCIGHVVARGSLCRCVREVAAAAARDPRFPPVRPDEPAEIELEISVLGPMKLARGVEDVEVGRDGLMVVAGRRSGVLLPQVATENGWTARQFIEQTCRKAGLPPDAWQWDGTSIYRFTATVFGEEDSAPTARAGAERGT